MVDTPGYTEVPGPFKKVLYDVFPFFVFVIRIFSQCHFTNNEMFRIICVIMLIINYLCTYVHVHDLCIYNW